MPELLSAEALAPLLGVSPQAVRKAHKMGRLSSINGKFDPAVAKIQWETNRRRRVARPGAGAPVAEQRPPADGGSGSGEGSDYWASKTRRETAEATMAELKLAELAGTLVLRDQVNRTIFGASRVMRDQLLAMAPRLAATLAPITDAKTIEQRIDDEIRVALRAFAQQLRAGGFPEGADGQPG